MHWACANGKPYIVKILLEKDFTHDLWGDLETGTLASRRIKGGGNALSLAIANWNKKCAEAIISSEQCLAAMRQARKETVDNSAIKLVTPLRDLIIVWPDLASRVLDQCISDNLKTSNMANNRTGMWHQVTEDSEHFQIQFNYELLEDTFVYDYDLDYEDVGYEEEGDDNLENVEKGEKEVATKILLKNHPLMVMISENKVIANLHL